MRIAYLGGTFDMLHPGHLKLLRWAKSNFGFVVVAVNGDEFVMRYKGKRPVMSLAERIDVLRELRSVDIVLYNFGNEDKRPVLRKVRDYFPDGAEIVVLGGSDWSKERLLKQMNLSEDFLKSINASMEIYPHSMDLHTTDIRMRM